MGKSRWNPFTWIAPPALPRLEPTPHGILELPRTDSSTTVFTGTASEWLHYLDLPRPQRYQMEWAIDVKWNGPSRHLSFAGHNEQSQKLAKALTEGVQILREYLEPKPSVLKVLHQLVFENPANGETSLTLHASPTLPSKATREVLIDDFLKPTETCLVLDLPSVEKVMKHLSEHQGKKNQEVRLALVWPLLRRVISQLAYPSYPRDRYLERIDLTTRLALLNIHVLFQGKRKGQLIPTRTGEIYQDYVSKRDGVPVKRLQDDHPYFKMLNNLGFMLNEDWERNYLSIARVIVRDYLDTRYVRLGIASVMPDISDGMQPMELRWSDKGKPRTGSAHIGRNGILDREDLDAWNKLEGRLKDQGFVPVRQLGMGQYGRVYECVNFKNSAIPRRVAIKVDRIRKKKQEEAILAAELILKTGQDLAFCPHVIRIFDAGNMPKGRHTYHVLQMVDGDTLDNLIGLTGNEHASILRPQRSHTSVQQLNQEIRKALSGSAGEAWRRERTSLPFTHPLSVSQVFDLLTSILLWVEEIHRLKYAVNDLKNGNLMVSRRGQLKGIDLDSYSPVFSPLDRQMDFHFLAISSLLFLFHLGNADPELSLAGMLTDENRLRPAIASLWPGHLFDNNPRISADELTDFLTGFLLRSRNGDYAEDSALFAKDIDNVIYLKRRIRGGEIVLD